MKDKTLLPELEVGFCFLDILMKPANFFDCGLWYLELASFIKAKVESLYFGFLS